MQVAHAWQDIHSLRTESARPVNEVLDDLYTVASPARSCGGANIPAAGAPQIEPQNRRVAAVKRLFGEEEPKLQLFGPQGDRLVTIEAGYAGELPADSLPVIAEADAQDFARRAKGRRCSQVTNYDDCYSRLASEFAADADLDEHQALGLDRATDMDIDEQTAGESGARAQTDGPRKLTRSDKVKIALGGILRVGLWGVGVAFILLQGNPQDAGEWISTIGSFLQSLLDAPMVYVESRACLGAILEKAWGLETLSQGFQKSLYFLAKVGGIVGILLALVSFIQAVIRLVETAHTYGIGFQFFLDTLLVVSAGLGLASAIVSTIAIFKAGSFAAMVGSAGVLGPFGLCLGLSALGIGLIVSGIKMLCPARPNFPGYMADEWPEEWSKTGDWPDQWSLLTTWERTLAVGQIVIGGVELSDDRVACAAAAKGHEPTPEDYIEAFLAAYVIAAQSSGEPARQGFSQLKDAMTQLKQMQPKAVVNLGLMPPGASRACKIDQPTPERPSTAAMCSMHTLDDHFLIANCVDDVLSQRLLYEIIPYLERVAEDLKYLPGLPNLAYQVTPINHPACYGHVLLRPLMPGTFFGRSPVRLGETSAENMKSHYESEFAVEDTAEEQLLPDVLARLVGAQPSSSRSWAFDMSQMLEFGASLPQVTSVLLDDLRGVMFVCEEAKQPLFPTVSPQDLSNLIKLLYFQPKYAAFSLDPDDPDWDKITPEEAIAKAMQGKLHYVKRVWPRWMQGTSLAEKLFEADYELKLWASGGLGDVGGLPGQRQWTRVWLSAPTDSVTLHKVSVPHPKNPNRCVRAITVIDVKVTCDTRLIQNDGHGGMKDIGVTDEQRAWSDAMTRQLQPDRNRLPCIQRLADVYRLRELVVAMKCHEMPVSYPAVEAMCLPERKTASHAPGRVTRAGVGRMSVGGCELFQPGRPRRVVFSEDEASHQWLRKLALQECIEPRPEYLLPEHLEQVGCKFRPAPHVIGAQQIVLSSPFNRLPTPGKPVALTPSCLVCTQKLRDGGRPRAIFQDLQGNLVCDCLSCIEAMRKKSGACLPLSDAFPCAWCFKDIDQTKDELRTLMRASGGLQCFHKECYERWPGHDDSDQKQFTSKLEAAIKEATCKIRINEMILNEDDVAQNLFASLKGRGLPEAECIEADIIVCRFFRRQSELVQNGLSASPKPAWVALLAEDWDALDAFHNYLEVEEQLCLEDAASELFRWSLKECCSRAAKHRIVSMEQRPPSDFCVCCEASLAGHLRKGTLAADGCMQVESGHSLTLMSWMCAKCTVDRDANNNVQLHDMSFSIAHSNIECDGCQRQLCGPRYTSWKFIDDNTYDLCELCIIRGNLRDRPDIVEITGSESEGLHRLVQKRTALVKFAASVIAYAQTTSDDMRACAASQSVRCLWAEHCEYQNAMDHIEEQVGIYEQQKQRIHPGTSNDVQKWLRYDVVEAQHEVWSNLLVEYKIMLDDCERQAVLGERQLREQKEHEQLIENQVDSIDAIAAKLQEASRLSQGAESVRIGQEKLCDEVAEKVKDALRRFAPVMNYKRFLLCPVCDQQHRRELLTSNILLGEGEWTTQTSVVDILKWNGMELLMFSGPDELSDIHPSDVAGMFVDENVGDVVLALALDASATLRMCQAGNSFCLFVKSKAKSLDVETLSQGLWTCKCGEPNRGYRTSCNGCNALRAQITDNHHSCLDSFFGTWPLPLGALQISGETSERDSITVSWVLANPENDAAFDCKVKEVAPDYSYVVISALFMPLLNVWTLQMLHDGSVECRCSSTAALCCEDFPKIHLKKEGHPSEAKPASSTGWMHEVVAGPAAFVSSLAQAAAMCFGMRIMRIPEESDPTIRAARELVESSEVDKMVRQDLQEAQKTKELWEAEVRMHRSQNAHAKRHAAPCNVEHRQRKARRVEAAVQYCETAKKAAVVNHSVAALDKWSNTEEQAKMEKVMQELLSAGLTPKVVQREDAMALDDALALSLSSQTPEEVQTEDAIALDEAIALSLSSPTPAEVQCEDAMALDEAMALSLSEL